MSGRQQKLIRKAAQDSGRAAVAAVAQPLGWLDANEKTTRKRVDALEEEMGKVLQFRSRGFGARLRWLFFGK